MLVKDKDGNDFTGLAGGTYFGVLVNIKTCEAVDFNVSVAASAQNVLLLEFPALEAGRWLYEVWVSVEGGTRDRVVCGLYSTLKTVSPRLDADAVTPYDATLVLGYDSEVLTAYFNATSRAEMAAEAAQSALREVRESIDLLNGAKFVIETLGRGVAAAFTIGENGNWYVAGNDTGRPSRGERGMNADEIEYHLIYSEGELPTDAEHCNPNHRYVIQGAPAVAATGWVEFVMSPALADDFLWLYINNKPVIVLKSDVGVQDWADAINAGDFGVTAVADGEYLRLTARVAGAAGNLISLTSRDEFGQEYEPISGPYLTGGKDALLSEQYLWIEGAWRQFPLNAPSAATPQTDGLVRTSTEDVISDGLRIGKNADGQIIGDAAPLRVPDATTSVKGKVLLASSVTENELGVPRGDLVHRFVSESLASAKQDIIRDVEADFSATLDEKVRVAVAGAIGNILPLGSIITLPYDVDSEGTPPDGWMFCHGQEISRAEYSSLFAVIGETWGAGDGVSTFNLPDARNRFQRGCSTTKNVGTYEKDALPNITGQVAGFACSYPSGAFYAASTNNVAYGVNTGPVARFDAHRCSSVYTGVTEVRPNAFVAHFIIKVR